MCISTLQCCCPAVRFSRIGHTLGISDRALVRGPPLLEEEDEKRKTESGQIHGEPELEGLQGQEPAQQSDDDDRL
ncbi:MAG: hypothetical protein ACE1ZV_04725, partial [Alphaproteobacteria bacterium]